MRATSSRCRKWSTACCRPSPTRAGRAIAGDSMGGYGAMNVALGHPQRFAVVESWLGFFNGLSGELRAAQPVIAREGLRAFVYGARLRQHRRPAGERAVRRGAARRRRRRPRRRVRRRTRHADAARAPRRTCCCSPATRSRRASATRALARARRAVGARTTSRHRIGRATPHAAARGSDRAAVKAVAARPALVRVARRGLDRRAGRRRARGRRRGDRRAGDRQAGHSQGRDRLAEDRRPGGRRG